jgi:ATP-dependent Clp protease ATP-binding subunit ClpB
MTSNLGNTLWENGRTASRDEVMQILQAHFRPEFLNRIDEIVIFHPLTREHMNGILNIQLARVSKLLEDKGYRLEVSEAAREYLVEVGYNPVYGARPLKRALQQELQDPLALKILAGDFKEGDTIRVDRGPDGLTFSVGEPIAEENRA